MPERACAILRLAARRGELPRPTDNLGRLAEMWRRRFFVGVTAIILVLSAVALIAQGTVGRLVLTVKGEHGNRIQGARVTATCSELPKFREEKVTNKKGQVTLAFGDATKVYDLKIEHEGYPPLEVQFKPEIRQTITQEIKLSPGTARKAEVGDTATATERDSPPAERLFRDGVKALEANDHETARQKFLQALERDPDMVAAHSALGAVYFELGDYQAAVDSARRLLAVEPENPRGFRILYEAHQALGQQEEAQKALASLSKLEQGADTPRLVYNEGVSALQVGDTKRAKESFQQALELDPELTPALEALAIVLFNEGRYAEAAEAAEKLLLTKPENVKAMRITFNSYKALGDVQKEEMAFQRLVAVDPSASGRWLFEQAVDLFNNGDTEAARGRFEQALEADSSIAKAHYYLGLCFVNQGQGSSAREHLERFLAQAPDDPDAGVAEEMLQQIDSAGG